MTIAQNETFIRSAYKETGKGIVMLAQRVRDQEKTIAILLNQSALAADWDRLMQERVGHIALAGELRAALTAAQDRIPAVEFELHDICVAQAPAGIAVAVDVRGMPQVLAEFARLRETVNGQRHTIRSLQTAVAEGLDSVAKVRDANVNLQEVIAKRDCEIGRVRQLLAEREKADTFKAREIKPTTRLGKRIAGRKAKAKT